MSTRTAKPHASHGSLTSHARALATVLHEEFGVPFAFYDAHTAAAVCCPEGADSYPVLDAAAVAGLVAAGWTCVTPLADGNYQIVLLCYKDGKAVLVAVGVLTPLAGSRARAAEELARLRKWVQCVSDRLQQADQQVGRRAGSEPQAGPTAAWEVILTLDHLMRRLRIHRDQGKNQQRILQAALKLSGAQSLVWIPPEAEEPVLIEGEACLSPWDYRQLGAQLARTAESQGTGPLFCNEVQAGNLGARFPRIAHVLAFPVAQGSPPGWFLAINKKREASAELPAGPEAMASAPASDFVPFRRSDAALLTPFVALLDLHRRGWDRYRDLKELLVGLTRALTSAIDAKDAYTYGHSERVARIAVELGRELGLPEEDLSDIYLAGLLHDIGKIGVRDGVLCKPGPLTPEEFDHLKEHPTIGYKILKDVQAIRNLLPGVLHHHERWDGGGYPGGLAGEAIPLLPRILAVADAYDAMSTDRPYRKALTPEQIDAIMVKGAGSQWDPRMIQAFQRCRQRILAIRQRGIGESLRHALDDALVPDDSARVLVQGLM